MARGFVYLAVVLDWFSRRVLSWRVSITMEAAFCVEALEDALACHGKPEIFNTDQGSQFTGAAFTGVLIKNGIAVSMDGKSAWRDNVFVERLWRSVKYEEVYLRAYEGVSDARASIGRGTIGIFVCEAVFRHASTKRSLNITANCVFASNHSRGGRFQSAAA
jgi:putative transposase